MKTLAERHAEYDRLKLWHESTYPDWGSQFVIAIIFSRSSVSIDVRTPSGDAYVGSQRQSIAQAAMSAIQQFEGCQINDRTKQEMKVLIENRFSITAALLEGVVFEQD